MRDLFLSRNGFRLMLACVVSLIFWSPVVSIAALSAALADAETTEEVVVVGKRPGPPLWKVVKGEHTLFIFGSLDPLPKSLVWDSASVDWIISQSDEFISAPSFGTGTANPFRAIRALREIRKLERLPKGRTMFYRKTCTELSWMQRTGMHRSTAGS